MCDLQDAFSGKSLSDQQMKVTKGHDKLLGSLIGKTAKKKEVRKVITIEESDSDDSESEFNSSPSKVKKRLSKLEKENAMLSEQLNSKNLKNRHDLSHSAYSQSSHPHHLDMPASLVRAAPLPLNKTPNAVNQLVKRLANGGFSNDRNVTTFVVIILMGIAALFIADKIFSLNGK